MDFAEIKTKSEKELAVLLAEKRAELRDQRFSANGSQLKNVRALRNNKKIIAKILTQLKTLKK
jgi:ribosomal protein L29